MFSRSLKIALAGPVLMPMLLVAGCAGTKDSDGTVNRGLESVHQPIVSRTDFIFDVNAQSGQLPAGELNRLKGWLTSLGLGYGDKIAIDDPTGAAAGAHQQVAEIIAQAGLFLSDQAPITTATPIPGTIRIVVTRSTAKVENCPDYSRMSMPEFQSNTSSNFGCATNSNLAAMIARPEDLVRGRSGADVSDPAVGNKAIDALRKAAPTGAGGLKSASAGGGN